MSADEVGVVVIGRNEGERLRRCLKSIQEAGPRIYVDSGSTDGSQDIARSLGFAVLELDQKEEFTAARARNLGITYLAENNPEVGFVQMVDGDCEVVEGWARQARQRLIADQGLAIVFGRRRERYPERNVYHRACEVEWNVSVGDADSSGGDALFRFGPLVSAGGFNPGLIAGEEPDLCFRLRKAGWRVYSDGKDMTLHDVDISGMSQWWRRALRAGYGISELAAIHGLAAEKGWRRLLVSGYLWSFILVLTPCLLLSAIMMQNKTLLAASFVLAVLVCFQVVRTGARSRASFRSLRAALSWAALLLVSKLAQVQGALLYWWRRLSSSRRAIIEYK